jgi:glucose-1-phosphate thymidylyltransferase
VLAAGYATRLYPITENFPKPLLEIKGKTILDWLTRDIAESTEEVQFVIATNEKYAEYFNRWTKTVPFKSVVVNNGTLTNETRLGAVCDMKLALETVKPSGDVLVIAGDNLLDFSLSHLINYALLKKTTCVMRYHEKNIEVCKKSGVLEIDIFDRVIIMQEKPETPLSQWLCPPFYFFTSSDAAKIPQAIINGCGTDAPGSYIAWLCNQSPVHAMFMPGRRYDIGNIASLEQARKEYKVWQYR